MVGPGTGTGAGAGAITVTGTGTVTVTVTGAEVGWAGSGSEMWIVELFITNNKLEGIAG